MRPDRSRRAQRASQPAPSRVTLADARAALERALAARRALLDDPQLEALRVFNGAGDGVEGLVIERFGDVLVAQLHDGRLALSADDARTLCAELMPRLGATATYQKRFVKDRSAAAPAVAKLHADPRPWLGAPAAPEIAVGEQGVRHIVRPYDGFSVGMFLDHRDNRLRVRQRAAGRRVLNMFAYACGYSVCAALGGAAETVSVDVSRRYLAHGRANFAANDLALNGHVFINSDVFDYLRRAQRQGRRFELIILDPPSFGRDKRSGRTFVVEDQLENLVAASAELLEPDGLLLLSCNHRQIPLRRLERAVRAAAGQRPCETVETPPLPADFVGDPDYAKSLWARLG